MSSFSLFPAAGETRPFLETPPAVSGRKLPGSVANVVPASRLEIRPAPEMTSSGVNEIDNWTGGLPRGCLTEVSGAASSGRTSLLLAVLAAATRRQEACALVDVNDAFDPQSAARSGVCFEKLLWIRCSVPEAQNFRGRVRPGDKKIFAETPVEQALRVTDLLLQSSGFGLVAIDLGDTPLKWARRIPLASWFRFQRAVEKTSTVLFVVTPAPCAQTCATLAMKLSAVSSQRSADTGTKAATHSRLLHGLHIESELLRSRLERKPARSATATFASTATRTGSD
jgi:hypothetical protein